MPRSATNQKQNTRKKIANLSSPSSATNLLLANCVVFLQNRKHHTRPLLTICYAPVTPGYATGFPVAHARSSRTRFFVRSLNLLSNLLRSTGSQFNIPHPHWYASKVESFRIITFSASKLSTAVSAPTCLTSFEGPFPSSRHVGSLFLSHGFGSQRCPLGFRKG